MIFKIKISMTNSNKSNENRSREIVKFISKAMEQPEELRVSTLHSTLTKCIEKVSSKTYTNNVVKGVMERLWKLDECASKIILWMKFVEKHIAGWVDGPQFLFDCNVDPYKIFEKIYREWDKFRVLYDDQQNENRLIDKILRFLPYKSPFDDSVTSSVRYNAAMINLLLRLPFPFQKRIGNDVIKRISQHIADMVYFYPSDIDEAHPSYYPLMIKSLIPPSHDAHNSTSTVKKIIGKMEGEEVVSIIFPDEDDIKIDDIFCSRWRWLAYWFENDANSFEWLKNIKSYKKKSILAGYIMNYQKLQSISEWLLFVELNGEDFWFVEDKIKMIVFEHTDENIDLIKERLEICYKYNHHPIYPSVRHGYFYEESVGKESLNMCEENYHCGLLHNRQRKVVNGEMLYDHNYRYGILVSEKHKVKDWNSFREDDDMMDKDYYDKTVRDYEKFENEFYIIHILNTWHTLLEDKMLDEIVLKEFVRKNVTYDILIKSFIPPLKYMPTYHLEDMRRMVYEYFGGWIPIHKTEVTKDIFCLRSRVPNDDRFFKWSDAFRKLSLKGNMFNIGIAFDLQYLIISILYDNINFDCKVANDDIDQRVLELLIGCVLYCKFDGFSIDNSDLSYLNLACKTHTIKTLKIPLYQTYLKLMERKHEVLNNLLSRAIAEENETFVECILLEGGKDFEWNEDDLRKSSKSFSIVAMKFLDCKEKKRKIDKVNKIRNKLAECEANLKKIKIDADSIH